MNSLLHSLAFLSALLGLWLWSADLLAVGLSIHAVTVAYKDATQ